MLKRAPRLLLRPLRRLMRGGLLMSSLWMAGAAAAEVPAAAQFVEPTTRYQHGVLGDAIEWGGLEFSSGKRFRLPEALVFEDLTPRVVEIDGVSARDKEGNPSDSGQPDLEFMVVESHQSKGARLALWDDSGRLAVTPFIGQRNRWLAPIGAGDLDGDGRIEVAYIDRPHLAKTLRVWRYENGELSEVAAASGFSNHQIGWDYIEGGLRDCGNGPEMIVASGNWREVRAVRFDGSKLSSRRLGAYSAAAIKQAMACK